MHSLICNQNDFWGMRGEYSVKRKQICCVRRRRCLLGGGGLTSRVAAGVSWWRWLNLEGGGGLFWRVTAMWLVAAA